MVPIAMVAAKSCLRLANRTLLTSSKLFYLLYMQRSSGIFLKKLSYTKANIPMRMTWWIQRRSSLSATNKTESPFTQTGENGGEEYHIYSPSYGAVVKFVVFFVIPSLFCIEVTPARTTILTPLEIPVMFQVLFHLILHHWGENPYDSPYLQTIVVAIFHCSYVETCQYHIYMFCTLNPEALNPRPLNP